MSLPTVVFVVPAAVCLLAWWGLGTLVPSSRLEGLDPVLAALTRLAAGILAWAVILLGLGLVGLFQRPLLIGATALGALVALRPGGRPPRLRLPEGRMPRGLLAALGVALLLDLVAAAAPPTSADALTYHLALPAIWLDHGEIRDVFWQWLGFNPNAVDLLYAQGSALGGGAAAQVLGAVLGVLSALAVYGLARSLARGSALAGAAGAALFALQGIVTWVATSAFVELGTTFFAVLAAWLAVEAARSRRANVAAWAGFAAGGAAATKYTGLFVVLLVVGGLAIAGLARRSLRPGLAAGACAVLAGGAWYAKNAIVAGNPVYPFLVGGHMWTASSETALPGLRDAYGVGGSALRLIILPLDLVLHGGRFDRGQYVDVLLFPLALLGLLAPRRRAAAALLSGAALLVAAWWLSSPQARFLLPALALLASLAGAGIAALWARHGARLLLAPALGAAAVLWLVPSAAFIRSQVPVSLGLESRPAFVQKMTGTYDALRRVAASTDGTLAFAGYPALYYFPRPAVYLGIGEFAPDVPRATYLERLRGLGVRYVLAQNPSQVPNLNPIRACLRDARRFPARFVTSRTRGTSEPMTLVLYSLRGCG